MIQHYQLERFKDEVIVSAACTYTQKSYSVTVKIAEWNKYLDGVLAQNAFPDLSLGDREFLISGTSPEGWKELFDES